MDFVERLKDKIIELKLPIKTIVGVNTADESAGIYPLPGGQVTKKFYDGIQEEKLNFEYAIKSKRQREASDQLWQVTSFIERLEDLESSDGSFEFGSITITSKPAQSQADEQGFFYWVIDFSAELTTFKNNGGLKHG